VPLVLGGFTAIGYGVGKFIEKRTKSYSRRHYAKLNPDIIQHRIFAICTFGIFNFFFFFAGRPLIQLLPLWVQYVFDVSLVFLSTLWLQKTWRRDPVLYSRENLASRFRKQLEKMPLDFSQYLEGRSLDDLDTNEVYVLAKVLPGFTREKRHQVYKGVVRDALEEGYVNYSNSLAVLQQMRQELGIPDDEHLEVLEELGIENPELLNPNRQRTLENQIRLSGYQKSLERLMRLQQIQPDLATVTSSTQDSAAILSLRSAYSITPQEEDWMLNGFSPDISSLQNAEVLLARLAEWSACDRALNHLLRDHQAVLTLLQDSVYRKQELLVQSILEALTTLGNNQNVIAIAHSLRQLSPKLVAESLNREYWQDRLHPEILQSLKQPEETQPEAPLLPNFVESSTQDTLSQLEMLLEHYNPLVQSAALYSIAQLDPERAQTIARELRHESHPPLVQETAERLLSLPFSPPLKEFPTLEKLVYLFNSDFFHRLQTKTLIALGDRAEVKTYSRGDVITEAGDTCRELLLLLEGDANIHYQSADEVRVERFHPGQTLDELDVLTHSNSENTIIADSEKTRVIAIPIDAIDDLLDHDLDFARRILELESRQLQRLVKAGKGHL
jgi:hypothetical protein